MDLIENDGADAWQLRIGQQPAQQNTGRAELHLRSRAALGVPTNGVPDLLAESGAAELRQTPGSRTHRHAPRSGDHDPTVHRVRDNWRHDRRFAGAGRSLDDRDARGAKGLRERFDCPRERQIVPYAGDIETHALSLPLG